MTTRAFGPYNHHNTMTRSNLWLAVFAAVMTIGAVCTGTGIHKMSNVETLSTENTKQGAELFLIGFLTMNASVLPLKAAGDTF